MSHTHTHTSLPDTVLSTHVDEKLFLFYVGVTLFVSDN